MTVQRMYTDWRDVPIGEWNYRNFTPKELACPCCDSLLVVHDALYRLQAVRAIYGKPIRLASAYRCPKENQRLGGTADGPHTTGTAFDPKPVETGGLALAQMEDAFWKMDVLGRGKGRKDGVEYVHFDWDRKRGKRSWYYGT